MAKLSSFKSLWNSLLLPGQEDNSESIYQQLVAQYSEPHRHYHTLEHIDDCLQEFALVKEQLHNPEAAEMTIWFHDVIYERGVKDNERRSADLFLQLSDGKLSDDFRQKVEQMIMATTHRDKLENADADTQFVVDIDISGLSQEWASFYRDSENIRKEFSHQPDAVFFCNQIKFLKGLMEGREIFYTPHYRRNDEAARKNLQRYFDLHQKDAKEACVS